MSTGGCGVVFRQPCWYRHIPGATPSELKTTAPAHGARALSRSCVFSDSPCNFDESVARQACLAFREAWGKVPRSRPSRRKLLRTRQLLQELSTTRFRCDWQAESGQSTHVLVWRIVRLDIGIHSCNPENGPQSSNDLLGLVSPGAVDL